MIPLYSHRQTGWVMLWSLGGASLLAWSAAIPAEPSWIPALVIGLFLLALALFSSLMVEVRNGTVEIRFGVGLIHKRFSLDDLVSCSPVRNAWYYGWGIRFTPHGWLYNVSGLDAVELRWKGGRKVRIGTDEPEALTAAIRQALAVRASGQS